MKINKQIKTTSGRASGVKWHVPSAAHIRTTPSGGTTIHFSNNKPKMIIRVHPTLSAKK